MASVSAHKIHGPKGVVALYIRPGLKLEPILHGGGQQHGMRSGTENVALIEGLALAAQIAAQRRQETPGIVRQIRDRLVSGLAGRVDHEILSQADAYPGILNVAFPGMPAEAMLHALESEGVYVSTGSACSSRKRKTSPVLRAMGIPDSIAASALRFSFSIYNSCEEADAAAEAIVRILDRYPVRSTKNR